MKMLAFNLICGSRTYIHPVLPKHILCVPTFGTENIAYTFLFLCQQRKFFPRRCKSQHCPPCNLLGEYPSYCHYVKLVFTIVLLRIGRLIICAIFMLPIFRFSYFVFEASMPFIDSRIRFLILFSADLQKDRVNSFR